MKRLLLFAMLVLVTSCNSGDPGDIGARDGLKPIYISEAENVVENQEARGFENLGKIVYAAPYLLINERFKGIHVINNTNPSDPEKISFIQIPGNTDFTLKGQFLYANYGSDLITIELGGVENGFGLDVAFIGTTKVIENIFSNEDDNTIAALFPPNYTGFFECVDPNGGIVIGWESEILINPECRI